MRRPRAGNTTERRSDAAGIASGPALRPDCFACRSPAEGGLGLQFRADERGGVSAEFSCAEHYRSYPDRLDGGIVAMLLDAAMTECLLQQGVAGVTGRLTIGYGEPVLVGVPAVVRARVAESRGVLHRVEAEIEQDGQSKVRGEGKFVPHPDAR